MDKRIRIAFLGWLLIGCVTHSSGQLSIKETILKEKDRINATDVNAFYQLNRYQWYWLGNKNARNHLIDLLTTAADYGLNEKDYQYNFIQKFKTGKALGNLQDSIEADISLSDAALHFFRELKVGNQPPSFRYNGLNYTPTSANIFPLLKQYLEQDKLPELALKVQPSGKEYLNFIKKLQQFNSITKDSDFKETNVTSTKINATNRPLLIRLYQLGVTDSVLHSISEEALKSKVKEALKLFDVVNDGTLRKTSLAALNVPLAIRIIALKLAINCLRWLDQQKQTSIIAIVNIPAATLLVYDHGKVVLDSKVIVGKSSTPTPTLTSTITEVILYPYWMVPAKIAVNELLPSIKRNINYLNIGNFQVINNDGKVLNPYAINWHSLSRSYFPYHIRQSTGCDNSLGIVKFNFYNPFTVYLHDTPAKSLFMLNKRYFSHGCMRVEKPIELAHLLLGTNRIAIDTLTEKGCLEHQSPVVVPVEKQLPVVIIYSTAWYDLKGEFKFYDDVYGKLE